MRTLLAAALLLGATAACSDRDAGAGNGAAGTTPFATPAPAASPTRAAAATPVAAPRPGAVKTFRDWTVACDNVRRCAMASLGPDGGDFPMVTMEVARDAGPAGGYGVSLASAQAGTAPAAILIDGVRYAVAGDGLAGAPAARIAAALARARKVAIVDATGATLAAISPAGAAAALRYVDAEQGRAGGVTATVATGPAPASAVPAAPPLPVVVAPIPGGTAAQPSAAQRATMKRLGRCEDAPAPGADWSPAVHALGDGRTLVVLPCSAGAYNVIGALFVIDGAKVTPAEVDAPAGFEATGADPQTPVHSVVNAGWDAGLLTSDAKGRGLGDCGVSQRFAWDGARLRLVEQSEMRECRGNTGFLRTWTARVERR